MMSHDRPAFLSPDAIERMCREAYMHLTSVYGKQKSSTWEELREKERTLVLDITGKVVRTIYTQEQGRNSMKVLVGRDFVNKRSVFHVCLQFQPKDAWVGIYVESLWPFRAYLCIIPCFPIHIKYEA